MSTKQQKYTSLVEKKTVQTERIFGDFKDNVKKKKTAITASANGANRSLKTIKSTESKVQKALENIQAEASERIKIATTDVETKSSSAKTSMSTALREVDETRKQTKKEYGLFSTTYRAAMNGTKGIAARMNDAANKHSKVIDLHKKVIDLQGESSSNASKVAASQVSASENEEIIKKIKDRAEVVKTEIENTYAITLDTALAGSIANRKKELESIVRFWSIALGISFITLVTVIVVLVIFFPVNSLTALLQERLAYITPIVAVIVIAYRQYVNERRLMEEYAFKAAHAQALRGYTVLLSEQNYVDDVSKSKILEFLLESMGNIFDRSSLDHKRGLLYELTVGGRLASIQAKLSDQAQQHYKLTETPHKKVYEETTTSASPPITK